jgi:carboxymethylenebutenolidase
MGEMIQISSNGATIQGYLARPGANANGRGVIVLQEWWGLVPHIKSVADRFAVEGYAALAPDLYRGKSTTSPDDAKRMLMALNIAEAEKDLRGTIRALKEVGGITGKVNVVGFCMGGQLAMLAATTNTGEIAGAVNFYGIHPNVKPDFSQLDCPLLGLFGEKDASVSPQVVAGLVESVRSAKKSIEHHIYPGVGHAFFNDARPEAYVQEAAQDAWRRTLQFFDDCARRNA